MDSAQLASIDEILLNRSAIIIRRSIGPFGGPQYIAQAGDKASIAESLPKAIELLIAQL